MTEVVSAKERKLADLRAARETVESVLEGLSDEALGRQVFEPWAAKDLVAHMASWAEVALGDVERLSRGHVPVLGGFDQAEIDEWNRGLMRGRALFPAAQSKSEYAEFRRGLEKALEQMPEAQFEEGNLICALCDIFGTHDREHAAMIRNWRAAQGL